MLRSFAVLLVLVAAPLAHAEIRASLPLHGFSRPGSFIPVRLEGTTTATEIEITGDGVTPTHIAVSGGAVNTVIPVLATSADAALVVRERDGRTPIPIQPFGNRRLNGSVNPLIANATGQRVQYNRATAIDVELDPVDPVPGPTIAWEALEYLIIEPVTAARMGHAKLLDLATAGVTILLLTEPRPPGKLPWVRSSDVVFGRTDVWALRVALRGPRGSVFEHALRPLAGAEPGLSESSRRNVLLAALLFTILATGAALLLPPGRPLVAAAVVGSVVLLTLGAVHVWWARQPAGPTGGGRIIVEQPPFTQVDTWMYSTLRPGATWNFPADLRPIAESGDALARLRPTLRCAADGTPIGFTCVGAGEPVAAVARNVLLGLPPTPNVDPVVTSLLLAMAQRGYLHPGPPRVAVVGQAPSAAWPSVVIRTVEPATAPTTAPATRAAE